MTDNGDAIPRNWSSGTQAEPRTRVLSGLFPYWDELRYTLSGVYAACADAQGEEVRTLWGPWRGSRRHNSRCDKPFDREEKDV